MILVLSPGVGDSSSRWIDGKGTPGVGIHPHGGETVKGLQGIYYAGVRLERVIKEKDGGLYAASFGCSCSRLAGRQQAGRRNQQGPSTSKTEAAEFIPYGEEFSVCVSLPTTITILLLLALLERQQYLSNMCTLLPVLVYYLSLSILLKM